MVRQTVRWTFAWSMGIAVIFMGIYHFAGVPLLKVMTSDTTVIAAARGYLPWLLLMPVIGCAAFTWDGIYIGATASKAIRNSMLWAAAGFALTWISGILVLDSFCTFDNVPGTDGMSAYGVAAMHVLMGAYFAHLLARTIYLSVRYRKEVLHI